MTSRRQLLLGVATSLSVAGCLGSGGGNKKQASTIKTELDAEDTANVENQGRSDEEDITDDEADPQDPLPGFTVQNIELSYYEHLGIITLLRIKNESGNDKFEIRTQASDPDGILTETDQWEEFPTSFERSMELKNDDIWALRNNIGRLTSFVIKGRVPGGEFGVVRAFSGEEFRKRVGVESDFEDPDVSVDSEEEETTEQTETEQSDSTNTSESEQPESEVSTETSQSSETDSDDDDDGGGDDAVTDSLLG